MFAPPAHTKWAHTPPVAALAVGIGALVRFAWKMEPPSAGAALIFAANSKATFNVRSLFPAACVTIGVLLYYYICLFAQCFLTCLAHEEASVKAEKDGEKCSFLAIKFGPAPPLYLRTAERAVGNLLEQLPPFFLALWLYALFVDAHFAGVLGWAWLCYRLVYPFVFYISFKRELLPLLMTSTVPAYAIVWYMLFNAASAMMDVNARPAPAPLKK